LEAIEKLDEGASAVLPGKMREYQGCDIGMGDPLVDEAGASVVDYDYGVAAVGCDV